MSFYKMADVILQPKPMRGTGTDRHGLQWTFGFRAPQAPRAE